MKVFENSLFRFILVGILNTICGMSIMFLLLNAFGLNYWLATFTGNCVGAIISYILNKKFTFKSAVSHAQSIWKFILLILFCYVVSYLSSYLLSIVFLSAFNLSNSVFVNNLAVLLGNALYTIINYLGQKYIVFTSKVQKQNM